MANAFTAVGASLVAPAPIAHGRLTGGASPFPTEPVTGGWGQ